MTALEPLGSLLTRLRNESGLGQKRAAQLAGIDNSTLSRLESGDRGVSREVLDRLADALSLDHRQRLDVLVAGGFLTADAAKLLADEDLAQLARLIADPELDADDVARLRQFVSLALAYATARGYSTDEN